LFLTINWGSREAIVALIPTLKSKVSGGKFYKELRLSEKCLSQPLKGLAGAGILEVVEDHLGDTYRAVYTVKFANGEDIYTVFKRNQLAAFRLQNRIWI
jgi:phage-related protein